MQAAECIECMQGLDGLPSVYPAAFIWRCHGTTAAAHSGLF